MLRRSPSAEASMLGGDDRTDDPVIADKRNFYKVGLWTRDDRTERMLFAGTSLDEARAVFADYARHRPAARLTIRQCSIDCRSCSRRQ
jgi:hypothetical protein